MLTQRRFLVMMPLYYLHIRNGDKLEVDPDGTELPDLDAALAEAVKVARELVDEVHDLGRDAVIEIADGSGETILDGAILRCSPATLKIQSVAFPITCVVTLAYPAVWAASLPQLQSAPARAGFERPAAP